MKTFAEVDAWCRGAEEVYGNPAAPICQLFFRWRPDLEAFVDAGPGGPEDLMFGMLQGELVLVCGPQLPLFPMIVRTGPPEINHDGMIVAYGAQRVTPGVWAISPSLNAEEIIHAFVVLYAVPDPAPWERLIVLP